jgi:hypothetical protein
MVDVGISAAQPSRRYLNDKMAWNGNWFGRVKQTHLTNARA